LDELTAARLKRYLAGRFPGGTINPLDIAAESVGFFCAELDRVLSRLAEFEAKDAARAEHLRKLLPMLERIERADEAKKRTEDDGR
jgi:hypothetical protein